MRTGMLLVCLGMAGCGNSGAEATSRVIEDAAELDATPTATGLPCEVTKALQTCTACHSKPPLTTTPMSLVTREDLMAASAVDPAQTNAQRAVARMKDTKSPMPPLPSAPAAAADIAAIQAWIDSGMPKGDCGSVTNPFATPPKCTSGKNWTGGDEGTDLMHPGVPCIACHKSRGKAPAITIGGTVYPSAHEPEECISQVTGVKVVITAKNGEKLELPVNANGNFFYDQDPIQFPYQAKVVSAKGERVMITAQSDGDCNACHTQKGTKDAPGRILAP